MESVGYPGSGRVSATATGLPETSEAAAARGGADLATVPRLREEWIEAMEARTPLLFVIYLTRVTFLDSTALGAIIRGCERQT